MGTGLLEATLTWLLTLRKEREFFPVLTRHCFADMLRSQVNLLASDEHIRELLLNLHNFGEVRTVKTYDSKHLLYCVCVLGFLRV